MRKLLAKSSQSDYSVGHILNIWMGPPNASFKICKNLDTFINTK